MIGKLLRSLLLMMTERLSEQVRQKGISFDGYQAIGILTDREEG